MAAGIYSIGSDTWPGLSKVTEEAGEVIQVMGKIIASAGAPRHFSGVNLVDAVDAEVADLYAALDYFVAHNPQLNAYAIAARRSAKLELFNTWHFEASTP